MAQTVNPQKPRLGGLVEFIRYCCGLGRPPWENAANLVEVAGSIGALEPLSATRPGACDPRVIIDKDILVPAATVVDGKVVPTRRRAIALCAPMNRALLVDVLQVTPVNLTASRQQNTRPEFKRVNIATFGEWCLPFEPLDEPNLFVNVEHIAVPPKAGFTVEVANDNQFSDALYQVHAEMWASC